MNITFVIGNGFDINCGMKCTYRDAYNGYIRIPSPSPTIDAFKKRIDANIDTWANFEVAMASDMKNYENEQDFLLCLRDFKKYLNAHLSEEEEKIKEQLNNAFVHSSVKDEMIESIESFYDGISHDISYEISERLSKGITHYQVISFNYTDIFEAVLSYAIRVDSNEIIHIHGKLNDDIVLGMDSLEQLPQVKYNFSKKIERAFIKTQFNAGYDKKRVNAAKKAIESSDIICVYGMSLGESDLTWRNALFQWLHSKPDVHLFLYDFKCSCMSGMTVDERMDNEEEAKYDILSKLGINEKEIEQYLPQMHIPCGKNIFNVEVAIQKGLNTEVDINKKKESMRNALVGNTT